MDFLGEVKKKLDIPPAEREQVMKELESHYSELRDELLADGMNECEAAREAERRLGDPAEIAQEMQTVHCRVGWKTAILMAVPILIAPCLSILWSRSRSQVSNNNILMVGALTFVVSILLLIPSIRSWIAGRRPVWLPTLLAAGITSFGMAVVGTAIALFSAQSMSQIRSISVIHVLSMWILALWLLKSLPKLRMAATIAAVLTVIAIFGANSAVEILALKVVYPGLMVSIALGVFAQHAYGGAEQAALFLFGLGGTVNYYGRGSHVAWMVLGILLSFATVLLHARETSPQRKLFVLAFGILAISLLSPSELILGHITGYELLVALGVSFEVVALRLFWDILIPILYAWRITHRKPEFAR